MLRRIVLLVALVAAALPGRAFAASEVVLADFEAAALPGVTVAAPVSDRAVRDEAFAASGAASLRFDIAGTDAREGTIFPRVWLENGSALAPADWSASKYLRVTALSANPDPATLYVVVRDRAGKFLQRSLAASPFAVRVFSIATADLAAAGVSLGALKELQVSTERAPVPKTLYVDDVRLADTPADEAALQAATAPKVIAAMGLSSLVEADRVALAKVEALLRPGGAQPDRALRASYEALRSRLDVLAARIPSLGSDIAAARSVLAELTTSRWRIGRLAGQAEARHARPWAPVGLGFADSMSLVYPRDLPCHCTWSPPTIGLARGEYESTQLVALPYGTGLTNASVRVATVRGPSRQLEVSVHPVGSLNLAPPVAPRPGVPTAWRPSWYPGWTPDPVLTSRSAVDVPSDDLQAYWIEVHAPASTKPGRYDVKVELTAAGVPRQPTTLSVVVWDVAIPDRPRLRTAIGSDPKAYAEPYGITDPDEVAAFNRSERAFLSTFKLQPDNIYRSIYESDPPSVESLREIEQKYGGLRQFNVWYFDPRLFDLARPETWDAQADQLFDRIQPFVDQYRAAGLVSKAYLYCCDETRDEYVPAVKHVLTRFHTRFPDVKVLTTAIDNLLGTQNGLGPLMDWWVRDVPWLTPSLVEQRRQAGQETWWYLHAGVQNPYPNVFLGYDPGQMRVQLGPMSHWSGVDGFLYYRVDRWYGHPVLSDGPLSAWDPRTWNNVAGDGSLLYPGPDGPMPSIRLHNMRDGFEDYNLLAVLSDALAAAGELDPALRSEAERLLSGSEVVINQRVYERDPVAYRAWRSAVADVLWRVRQAH